MNWFRVCRLKYYFLYHIPLIMNIDQAIEKLQESKKQWAERVVVLSSDWHMWWELIDIDVSVAYPGKPWDVVIEWDFTNPFTKEEYEKLAWIMFMSFWETISLLDPDIECIYNKIKWWINFYELQEEDIDDDDEDDDDECFDEDDDDEE